MKTVAVVSADLQTAPPGTRSRLAEMLCGRPVLRRTVERVLRAQRLNEVIVLSPPEQRDAVAALLDGLDVRVDAVDLPRPAYAEIVCAGRAWGLDAWRGGVGGLCAFDEDAHLPALAALLRDNPADVVALIPAHAALIAPDLIDAMIVHYETLASAMRLTFTPAPPGLAPIILARELIFELAPTNQPPGVVLAYQPGRPAFDLTGRECCYRPAAVIAETPGRLLADTQRSLARMQALIEAGADDWPAERIAVHLRGMAQSAAFGVPEEIEIELTTDDPLAATTLLRPRSEAVGRRGPMTMEQVGRIAEAIRGVDDVRIVLGGFGDPLLHPQVIEIARTLREAGALSIAVHTTGLAGDESLDESLFALPVDVLSVALDADTPQVYQAAHGSDAFENVRARVERWMTWREQRRQVRPLLMPTMVKATQTAADMEAFYDRWMSRLGCCSVEGYSHRARQRDDHGVMPMAPPRRIPCRRLWKRMLVLADGTVVACDQDFAARAPLGHLDRQTLRDIWIGPALAALRSAHLDARYNAHPLCPRCDEWHRP